MGFKEDICFITKGMKKILNGLISFMILFFGFFGFIIANYASQMVFIMRGKEIPKVLIFTINLWELLSEALIVMTIIYLVFAGLKKFLIVRERKNSDYEHIDYETFIRLIAREEIKKAKRRKK